jgi:hypothetical protein
VYAGWCEGRFPTRVWWGRLLVDHVECWRGGTLLGPEGTLVGGCFLSRAAVALYRSRLATVVVGLWVGGVVAVVSGCSLRTTQWMRASLWSSY